MKVISLCPFALFVNLCAAAAPAPTFTQRRSADFAKGLPGVSPAR